MERFFSGVRIPEETIAVDLLKKVGIGGNFLGERHTTQHLKEEHWLPSFIDRQTRGMWSKQGAKDMSARAHERTIQLLRTHQVEPLEKSVQEELQRIVRDAEKDIADA